VERPNLPLQQPAAAMLVWRTPRHSARPRRL